MHCTAQFTRLESDCNSKVPNVNIKKNWEENLKQNSHLEKDLPGGFSKGHIIFL